MALSAPSLFDRLADKPWLLAGVLVLVTFVAYQPVWHAGFIWDDDDHLTANPAMSSAHGLRRIWSSLAVSRYYPLTLTTFWVQRRFWGLNPMPYHLVNIALHAINGMLVFLILRRLRIPAAWLAAMLWVLHPVNVESAAWITELKNTQSGLFFYCAVWCFLRSECPAATGYPKTAVGIPPYKTGEKSAGDSRRYTGLLGILPYKTAGECGWYALAALCGAAAMLSKPSTVMLPLALLLCVWWEGGARGDGNSDRESRCRNRDRSRAGSPDLGTPIRNSDKESRAGREQVGAGARYNAADEPAARPYQRQYNCAGDSARYTSRKRGGWRRADIGRIAPFFIMALGMSAWTIIEQRGYVVRAGTTEWKQSMGERLVIAGKAVWFYAAKLLWPAQLTFVYPRWAVDAEALTAWMPLAALIGVAIVLWRWRRQAWARAGLFGLGFFVAALLPVLGFFDVYYFRYSFVADHFQYLASVGLIAVVASGGEMVCDRAGRLGRPMGAVAGPVILLSLAALTWGQARIYHDPETLWRDTLTKNPQCWMAHNNLGATLASLGRVREAMEHYEQSLLINPENAEAQSNLASALMRQGRWQEAIEHYEQALRIQPDDTEAHNNLGSAFLKTGRIEKAVEHYQQALRLKPDYAEAHNNLGSAFLKAGRVEKAIEHYRQAQRLKPDDAEPDFNWGLALQKLGRTPEAIEHYEQALRIQPDYVDAHINLGSALLRAGRAEEAIEHYQRALRLKPDFAELHFNWGLALQKLGRTPEAIEHYEQALRIQPDYADAHITLGNALMELGRLEDAIGQYEQALRLTPDSAMAHYNLGVALERAGRVKEANRHYEQARRIMPNLAEAQRNLARTAW
jgi:tetratricopeptide (TPR) repeat protein